MWEKKAILPQAFSQEASDSPSMNFTPGLKPNFLLLELLGRAFESFFGFEQRNWLGFQ